MGYKNFHNQNPGSIPDKKFSGKTPVNL